MFRWLEDNPLGKVLASVSAALIVSSLLLGVIWSLPPAMLDEGEGGGEDGPAMEVPQLKSSEPIESFAVITERPVFNPGRLPELGAELDEENLEEVDEEDVEAPEVELAGVIITPSIRMVTLRRKDHQESLVAFEGQPLEGDYGSWHVSHVEPRGITLSSGSGEEVRLELEVHDKKIKEPPKMAKEEEAADSAEADESKPGEDRPMSRAEEIRQRIAQRREELRQAAEAEEEAQARPADYRSAIQSLMGRQQDQAQDEDEQ